MRRTHLVLSICMVLSLVMGVVGVSAQTTTTCVNTVMVWDNDTLTSIAQRNNIVASELAAKNGLQLNARLRIGDVLCIDGLVAAQPAPVGTGALPPAPVVGTGGATTPPVGTGTTPPVIGTGGATSTTTTPPVVGTGGTTTTTPTTTTLNFRRGQTSIPAGFTTYTVTVNDNLFEIARKTNSTVGDIISANNITNVNIVYFGETLLVPTASTGAGALPPATLPTTPSVGTGGATTPTTPTTPATPANTVFQPAAGTIPVLTLPVSGQLGGNVTVQGANYPGNTPISLYVERPSQSLRSNVITQATTAANGTFSVDITLPTTWANGTAISAGVISVSGYATFGGYWAMNTLTATGGTATTTTPTTPPAVGTGGATTPTTPPTVGTGGATTPAATTPLVGTLPVIILPAQARPGSTITVSGSNYPANTKVTLYIERPSLGLKSAAITEVTTAANGTFSAQITIPTTWANGTAVNQNIISVSGYAATGGFWGMNYFVNQ